jgi:hypothetical protein
VSAVVCGSQCNGPYPISVFRLALLNGELYLVDVSCSLLAFELRFS